MDLRLRLEAARLNLPALFRALDQMELSPAEIPQRLIRSLFQMDADYPEAPWALDQPPGSLDPQAMLGRFPRRARSTSGNLYAIPRLAELEISVRSALGPAQANNIVPGH